MIDVFDVDSERAELADEPLDLVLVGIASHVSNLAIFVATKNQVNRPGESISDGNLGFIGGTEAKDQLVILGAIKCTPLHLRAMSGLDQDLSEVGVAWSGL